MNKLVTASFLAGVLIASGCGNSERSGEESTATTPKETPTEASPGLSIPGINDVAVSNELTLEGDDQMKFDKELFRVKAGETVKLTFKNVGEMPKESMGHNVVILKPGTDVAAFGAEAIKAVSNDYIPLTFKSSIVAHTALLGPGETDEIEFTLTEKGVYPYLCSFPGHYGVMQGKIVAE